MQAILLMAELLISSLLILGCASVQDPTGQSVSSSAAESRRIPRDPHPELVLGSWAVPVSQGGGLIQQDGDHAMIQLQVEDYAESSFDRYGFWDGSGDFEHAYGGNSNGSFTYRFNGLEFLPKALEIQARLSAESSTQGKPEEISDVELLINGQSLGRQTVMADDSKGRVYSWKLANPAKIRQLNLKSKQGNELRFLVAKDAPHQNGLCIYGRSLPNSNVQGGQPIALLLDVSAQ